MEIAINDIPNINVTFNCSVNNKNNLKFPYRLIYYNKQNPKCLDFKKLRNNKYYIDKYTEIKKNNPNFSDTKIIVEIKNDVENIRQLVIPYTENYFNKDNFNLMFRDETKISIGDKLEDFKDYIKKIKILFNNNNNKSLLEKINEKIKKMEYDINSIFLARASTGAGRDKKYFLKKFLLPDSFSTSSESGSNYNTETIENLEQLELFIKQFIKLVNSRETFGDYNWKDLSEILKVEVNSNYIFFIKKILNLINSNFAKEFTNLLGGNSNYINNYLNLFVVVNNSPSGCINKDLDSDKFTDAKSNIQNIFNKLDENLNKNREQEQYSDFYNFKDRNIEKVPKYNVPKVQKEILLKFSKYFYDKDFEKYSDSEKIEIINIDNNTVNIITYYNIFKILEILLLPDTILFIDDIVNEDTSKVEKYYNIKKITPSRIKEFIQKNTNTMKLALNSIFDIELEEITINSRIEFYINSINFFKNDYKIEKKFYQKLNIEQDNKNKNYNIDNYKNYGTSIFELNNSNNDIYIDDLKYNKIISEFNELKKTKLFKKLNVTDIREIFTNLTLFNYVKDNYKNNTDLLQNEKKLEKIIQEYYIDRFFFKLNNVLKINEKYGAILKYSINKNYNQATLATEPDLELVSETEQGNKKELIFNKIDNSDIRFRILGNNYIIQVFINIYLILSDEKNLKINLKQKILAKANCISKADNIDKILSKLNIVKNGDYAKELIYNIANKNKKIDNKSISYNKLYKEKEKEEKEKEEKEKEEKEKEKEKEKEEEQYKNLGKQKAGKKIKKNKKTIRKIRINKKKNTLKKKLKKK